MIQESQEERYRPLFTAKTDIRRAEPPYVGLVTSVHYLHIDIANSLQVILFLRVILICLIYFTSRTPEYIIDTFKT